MRPCHCGSGKPSWLLYDARGICCGRVCEECELRVRRKYRPEIFTDGNYWTDEPVEPEDSYGAPGRDEP